MWRYVWKQLKVVLGPLLSYFEISTVSSNFKSLFVEWLTVSWIVYVIFTNVCNLGQVDCHFVFDYMNIAAGVKLRTATCKLEYIKNMKATIYI